ncbi:MAG: hypothetical protein Q4D93_03095 [Porphyromonas sp.]|nr:hypothetical protein [Porphyromonas sp.]
MSGTFFLIRKMEEFVEVIAECDETEFSEMLLSFLLSDKGYSYAVKLKEVIRQSEFNNVKYN